MEEKNTGPTPEPIVLNYVWIDGFRGLNNIGFNLGGEYRYEMEQDGAGNYELTQTENEKYVEGFFFDGEKKNKISLISAIVGNNAAGKTSFMRALRMILMDKNTEYYVGGGDDPKFRKERFQYLIVYVENGARKCFRSFNLEKQVKNLKDIFPNSDYPDKKGFNQTPNQLINKLHSVFYSSMMDGSIYPIGTQPGTTTDDNHLDVSSDWLCYMDSLDYYELSKSDIQKNMMEFHKWEDTRRQIAFIEDNEKFRTEIKKFFPLPKRLTVYSRNVLTSGEYEEFLDLLSPYIQEARNFLKGFNEFLNPQISDLKKDSFLDRISLEYSEDNKRGMKEKMKFIFINHFLKQLISVLPPQGSNKKLDIYDEINEAFYSYNKGYFNNFSSTDNRTLEDNLSFIESFVLEKLPELLGFYSKDNKENVVKLLWDCLIKALEGSKTSEMKVDTMLCFFKIDFKYAEELQKLHADFTRELVLLNQKLNLEKNTFADTNFSFLSFDWSELSTGEKLIFNLFSRFHYAKKQMNKDGVDAKSSVLILIDEGELGFHLEWQRRYIDALVQVLPLIFGKKRPLQIIFTTHSPVSLSDIPRDNVVFLEKKETEESKEKSKEKGNAPEDKEYIVKVVDDPIETFGANIHAIVRNGFFLKKEGAMGEFAKKKITKLITELKELKNISDEKIEAYRRRIAMVDEPILRQGLDRLLMEKCTEKKEGKEQELFMQKQVEFYQRELKRVQELNTKKEHDQNN
jgi:GTPase SAR1 family protein